MQLAVSRRTLKLILWVSILLILSLRNGLYCSIIDNNRVENLTINIKTIKADFFYKPSLPSVGQEIKFFNASIGDPDDILWNFGDGQISLEKNPAHNYINSSLYYVTLCVSKGGITSQATRAVLIKKSSNLQSSASEEIKADFMFDPERPEIGVPVRFYDKSTGNPLKRKWRFGYFGISLLPNPIRTFFSEGKYAVTLTVENESGVDRITKYVEVVQNTSKNIIIAKSCSLNDIKGAIKIANPGDTVVVPSGEASWSQQLVIDKGIILKAAVKGGTTIYATYQAPNNYGGDSRAYLIVYEPSSSQADPIFRLSGFRIISSNSTTSILTLRNFNVSYPLRRIRIDNNYFKTGTVGPRKHIGVIGAVYGVADNNVFEDGSIISYGDNETTWQNLNFNYGAADNFYFEDNRINLTTGSIAGGAGGRYAFRHNTWSYTASAGLYPWFDAHGNQGAGANLSHMGVEIYNETMYFNMPSGYGVDILDIRGGKALCYNINVIFKNSGTATAKIREEYSDYLNPPAFSPDGQPQHPSSCYFFLLRQNGSTQVNVGVGQQVYYEDGQGWVPTEDKEFFLEKSNFNGSSGVGVGPLSKRPASCSKEGVAWWATDENKLYRWKNGKWELYYVPYTYPHPLRTILGD